MRTFDEWLRRVALCLSVLLMLGVLIGGGIFAAALHSAATTPASPPCHKVWNENTQNWECEQ